MTDQQKDQGFSLVELLIVRAVVLILAGFAVPQIRRSVHNHALAGVAGNVTRMVQLARYTAISQGSNACTLLAGNLFGVDANCNGTLDADETAAGPTTAAFSSPIPPPAPQAWEVPLIQLMAEETTEYNTTTIS